MVYMPCSHVLAVGRMIVLYPCGTIVKLYNQDPVLGGLLSSDALKPCTRTICGVYVHANTG